MNRSRLLLVTITCFGLLTGCSSTGGIGAFFAETFVETLFDTDSDKLAPESRRHWNEATSGGWDGVHHSVDY